MTQNLSFPLSRLVAPVSEQEFLASYWERKPLVIRRNQHDYWGSLLTRAMVDEVLTSQQIHTPQCQIANNTRRVEAHEYSFQSGMIDVARLYQQFADGGTIILPNLELRIPSLAALVRSMEAQFSMRFQTNIYFTPKSAQGFKTHYDTHDVFVMQVAGTKHWLLYDTPIELPYRAQDFNSEKHKAGPVSAEFILEPGDLVYIPRGLMHDARTTDTDSLHITLGALFTSWTDLLLEAIAQYGMTDVDFRRSLPMGFSNMGFNRADAEKTFRALLHRVAEKADFTGPLEHFIDDMLATRHPVLPGQLGQIERLRTISPDDRAGVRPDLIYRIDNADNDQIKIAAYGTVIALPSHAREPAEYALKTPSFVIRDLPGDLDDDGKVVLVRRMVREGMLHLL